MAIFQNSIIPAAAAAAAADDDVVTKSLRFDGTSYLTRTPASNGDLRAWTYSLWTKRTLLGAYDMCFLAASGANIQWNSYYTDRINFNEYSGGHRALRPAAKYRDVSSWYHLVFVWDADNSTTTDRMRIYVNGSRITSFSGNSGETTGGDSVINSTTAQYIGMQYDGTEYLRGYLADVYFIDGTALDATSFAEEDATTGQWKPKAFSGTYGTNGFHLDFEDDTDIGNDVSGNNNDFTATNLAASDVVNDTPTDNYCVLNALDSNSTFDLREGNLQVYDVTGSNNYDASRGSIALPSSGKWYWEAYFPSISYVTALGISDSSGDIQAQYGPSTYTTIGIGSHADTYNSSVPKYNVNVGATSGSAWNQASNVTGGSIMMLAVDMDNGSMWWGKDGTWFNPDGSTTANPASNAGPKRTGLTGTTWFPYCTQAEYSSNPFTFNFGQDPFFAGGKTSGQDTSQSEFYYAPPTGFSALSTGNLPTPTIAKPSEHFSTTLYSGNSGTQSITTGLEPDLLWIKNRGASSMYHQLFDSVRGLSAGALVSNNTDTEDSVARIASLDSTGFTTSSTDYSYTNSTSNTYVAWSWKAGTSFDAGGGSGTGSKNVDAGFSIAKWTGDDDGMDLSGYPVPQAITHGLTVTPEMIIVKNRTANSSTSGNWAVYHKDLTSGTYLALNSTGMESSWGTGTGEALFSSIGATTVSVSNDAYTSSIYLNYADNTGGYGSDDTYIGYFFASKAGFSKCGTWVGTGVASTGPFIYTGFRPAWVMHVEKDTGSYNWVIHDSARDPNNDDSWNHLIADGSDDENGSNTAGPDYFADFLSNGFKLNSVSTEHGNGSGKTYIYIAFAESPFKYANAR